MQCVHNTYFHNVSTVTGVRGGLQREPLARDLRALVRRRQRARGRARSAVATAAGRAAHDTTSLVLLDYVELLLDELVGGVERGAAALPTCVRPKRVLLRLEMLRQRLASRWADGLLRGLRAHGLLRRLRSTLERLLRVADNVGPRDAAREPSRETACAADAARPGGARQRGP